MAVEPLLSLSCLPWSKWDVSKTFKTLFTHRHMLSFFFAMNKYFTLYFLGRNRMGLNVQVTEGARSWVWAHSAARRSWEDTAGVASSVWGSAGFYMSKARKYLNFFLWHLQKTSGLPLFFIISWKNKQASKNQKVAAIKICRETSFINPEGWRVDVAGQNVSENVTWWNEGSLGKRYA